MPLVRPLVLALIFAPLLGFAQAAPEPSDSSRASSSPIVVIAPDSSLWSILPNQAADDKAAVSPQEPSSQEYVLLPNREGNLRIVKPSEDKGILIAGDSPILGDFFCLSIRSYVVARDRKDSDSTHLVRSSTCVPASKYKVKVVPKPETANHP